MIRVRYLDSENQRQTRFCLNNASIGVTAEANALFNRQPGFVRGLRKVSVNAAIAMTAVKTIFLYRNIACRLSVDGGNEEEFMVTNLGIVKNPHFAGSLRYETTVQPDDGRLGVHLCEKDVAWSGDQGACAAVARQVPGISEDTNMECTASENRKQASIRRGIGRRNHHHPGG